MWKSFGVLGWIVAGVMGCAPRGAIAETSKGGDVLDLPLTSRKLVVAHYMTEMLYCDGARPGDIWDPAMYSRMGPAAKLGGLIQTYPMAARFMKDASLEESVAFEMRAAMRLGVDGFQFFYPCVLNDKFMRRYGEIIKMFFRMAAERKLDFKLTLCLCDPDKGTEKQKLANWTKHIRDILSETRDSPNWLTTPDGRTIFYLWCPDALSDCVDAHWQIVKQPERVADVAAAYERLARSVDLGVAYIYHVRWPKDPEHVKAALDHFPAVWGWTDSFRLDDGWEDVAALCRRRKRDYTQTVYPDYYTSKLYTKGKPPEMISRLDQALRLGRDRLERHTQVCGLSAVYRKLLARAVRTEASLINFVTWNDFPEGHHLAPEVNHNFGFSLILQHYANLWRGRPERNRREAAVVLFKKYRHDAAVRPFRFDCRTKESFGREAEEDVIEMVTMLNQPAKVVVNGTSCGQVGAGLQVTRAPMRAGEVRVELTRNNQPLLTLTAPEWITDAPYRTDRLTYTFSSEFDTIFRDLFGDVAPIHSREYAPPSRRSIDNRQSPIVNP